VSTDPEYTARLEKQTGKSWKRLLRVQAPFRRHIRRVVEGEVLDVGCGIGRNLAHLEGRGVGVDTNPSSVQVARQQGLDAYTVEEFLDSSVATPDRYGTLLIAHVLEHMSFDQASDLVGDYLRFLRPGGKVLVIVPQEAGFKSDPTHVAFLDLDDIARIESRHGLARERDYSFPFPRFFGAVFLYNETVAISRKP
jgi:SAM-dependent methyltransferase